MIHWRNAKSEGEREIPHPPPHTRADRVEDPLPSGLPASHIFSYNEQEDVS